MTIEYGGLWEEGKTENRETEDRETREASVDDEIEADVGTPRQELVFIGVAMAQAEMIAQLDAALLTDAELAQGPKRWRKFRDKLPTW